MPAKREVVSLQPYVVLYHDFVTDTEAEDIKSLARPGVSAHRMWSNNPCVFNMLDFWELKKQTNSVLMSCVLVDSVRLLNGFVIQTFGESCQQREGVSHMGLTKHKSAK